MVYLWTVNANWTKRKCSFITTNNRSENVLTQPIYFLLWNSKGCTENNILLIFVFMQWKWKGLKKGLICLSLSVSIQTCQFVTDAVTLSRIHVHCVEKSNLHSLRFLLLYSTQEKNVIRLGTTRCYFWYRWTCLCQNARGLWPANESTHAELMPPNSRKVAVGQQLWLLARCTPLACPSPHGARSDALYSHPAQDTQACWAILGSKKRQACQLTFPTGCCFLSNNCGMKQSSGDEWEQPKQAPGW